MTSTRNVFPPTHQQVGLYFCVAGNYTSTQVQNPVALARNERPQKSLRQKDKDPPPRDINSRVILMEKKSWPGQKRHAENNWKVTCGIPSFNLHFLF